MLDNFIDLNRSFATITKDHDFDIEDDPYAEVLAKFVKNYHNNFETKTWVDLFQLQRVIILAEAGAGKTAEIRSATKKLRREGRKAFFFRLEHINSGFDSSFEIGEKSEFDEWRTCDEQGWFFLDSVDEARLLGPKQFELAIRKFGSELGDGKQRSHIYITSRISEWRPQSDLILIKEKLPFESISKPEIQDEEGGFVFTENFSDITISQDGKYERGQIEPTVFALRPLNQDQIRIYAQAFDIKNLNDFLNAIEKAEAKIFSTRPGDLEELITYWKKHGKIASPAKLIEHNISSKLKEGDPDRLSALPLTPEKARQGSEILAATATFLKLNRILIPEQNVDSEIRAESIDAHEVLGDWSFKEIQALLQRPIFDEAIYGAVRFHHRSIREYLTAQWLNQLLIGGKSRRAIENLFFTERYGQQVVVPSLRPILAWLILLDDRIRAKTAKIAPEIFIQGGDPSALPTEIRQFMLTELCGYYANQHMPTWWLDDSVGLQRFSHPDLGQTISHLLERYPSHKKIQYLLLQMIWLGNITACSEQALNCALKECNNSYTRIYGIRIIKAVGTQEQQNRLVEAIMENPRDISKELLEELISAFLSDLLNSQQVFKLLKEIEPTESLLPSSPKKAFKEFCQYKCPEDNILEWIRELAPLLKEPPVIEDDFHVVSKQYNWLLPCLALAAERLIRIQHPDALHQSVIEIISLMQAASSFVSHDEQEFALAELVPRWTELNYALLALLARVCLADSEMPAYQTS
jgi:hypothetical protein